MSVVVLGSINLDLVARIDKIPVPGETRMAHGMLALPGGKGANQALAACRMGAHTIMLGMVGEDAFAMQALKFLRQDGVDLSRIGVSKTSATGLAFIVVEDGGQNAITVVPGANGEVGTDALTDLQQILGPKDILVVQCEIPIDVVERAILTAKKVGARVIWDPAPASKNFPKSLFKADIVAPNQGEAEILVGGSVSDVRTAKIAARHLRARGAEVGIVKLGSQGVVWATARGLFYLPAEDVAAIDAVGAGDAFAGALAAGLDKGEALSDAIRIANRAAALSTTKEGAQSSFPWLKDVLD
ncbi:MAG: ribokinase [Sulfobacillus benefaciens]|uniref:Ribokinase n=1 Tax=Sulfobacillus benefaciens TaxID=453960 RepID=A0A2T2XAS0_9FIRM|nr:MAG: ribokinase [Sulfobacillus benefaciens]